jgi:hypothetical protein
MIRFSKDFHKINQYFISDEDVLESGRDSNIVSYRNYEADEKEQKKKAPLGKQEAKGKSLFDEKSRIKLI